MADGALMVAVGMAGFIYGSIGAGFFMGCVRHGRAETGWNALRCAAMALTWPAAIGIALERRI